MLFVWFICCLLYGFIGMVVLCCFVAGWVASLFIFVVGVFVFCGACLIWFNIMTILCLFRLV